MENITYFLFACLTPLQYVVYHFESHNDWWFLMGSLLWRRSEDHLYMGSHLIDVVF